MLVKQIFVTLVCTLITACAPFTPDEQARADQFKKELTQQRDRVCIDFPGTCFKPERGITAPRSGIGQGI